MCNNILSDFVCSNKIANCIQEKAVQTYKGCLPDYTVCNLHKLTKSTDFNIAFEEIINNPAVNDDTLANVSVFFITKIAGLCFKSQGHMDINPNFIDSLDFAQAHLNTNSGKLSAHWRKGNDKIQLDVYSEGKVKGDIILPEGYIFADGTNIKAIEKGEFFVEKKGNLYEKH